MKNLHIYKVVEMTQVQKLIVEGGYSDPDGCAGCAAGSAIRHAIVDFIEGWFSLPSGGYAGMGYY